MIGARAEVIEKAEGRESFKAAMAKIGLDLPKSVVVRSIAGGPRGSLEEIGLPCIIRRATRWAASEAASPTTGRSSRRKFRYGLDLSPVNEVMLDESILGWKEYEMEVMRDCADNCVIICAIENFDPMGVHTGDSITVAPTQTLTDKEYQRMRDATIACMREIGVETGGSNVQFAINPETGRMVVIEMNPRVSRFVGTGVQGDRVSDRQDRRQARGRIPAGRDPQRHHPRDARLLRADDRLRGHQDPAVDVREIPRRRPDAHRADEVGRGDDGDRPDVQGVAAKGAARTGDRTLRPRRRTKDLWGTDRQPSEDEIRRNLATPNAERIFYPPVRPQGGHDGRGDSRSDGD